MCVDSTTRAASELGFTCTVVADACAAPDLALGDVTVPGATVHAAFLAAPTAASRRWSAAPTSSSTDEPA